MSYYGNGGWNWDIVYNLPIHVRRYCLKLLNNAKQEEKKQIDAQSKGAKGENSIPKIPSVVSQNIKPQMPTRRPSPKK